MIITGATASGKSAYALEAAKKQSGVIINADSMQIYKGLPILSAQPNEEEQEQAEHRLYGFVDAKQPYNVGDWLEDASIAVHDVLSRGKLPLIVGGTGLYLKALMEGLSPIPDIPAAVRKEGEALGHEAMLATLDAETKAAIDTKNPRRVARAWEVEAHTGKRLIDWHDKPQHPPFPDARFTGVIIEPQKEAHWQKIHERFVHALDNGAVEEVEAMLQRNIPDSAQIRMTHGYREIEAMLNGQMTRDEVIERTCAQIRQYTKRQRTWFRNQLTSYYFEIIRS